MKEKRNYTMLTIMFFILGILLYTTYVTPVLNANNEKKIQLMELKNQLQIAQTLNENDVKNRIKELDIEKRELDKILPDSVDEAEVVTMFYSLIKKHNLTGQQIKFTNLTTEPLTTTEMNVYGDIDNLKKFINELQGYKNKVFNVSRISILNNNDSCFLSFSVKFY